MALWPFPAPRDDGRAGHLLTGTPLPEVSLPATNGPDTNLRMTLGRAIVFVYPYTGVPGQPNPPDWDHIPGAHGSTPQAEDFRDQHSAFTRLGVDVFGLSSQSTDHQREFANRLQLCFPLLSDEEFKFADQLKLPRFETGGVTYLKRLTLMIGNGCIERVIYPVHPPHTHASDLLEILARQD